jgi:RNA polymerase subunit RPABC4/transcription elongation factor Spt4
LEVEMGRIVGHELGICPVCGSHELTYGAIEPDDALIYYPYQCNACEASGKEWYDVVFVEIDSGGGGEDDD